ncbi:rhodanese-related sulfurtransferase [Paenibacillus phyllosphaerae]|uniref:Rhodanese-related sulfurtransferase n=1 Tax=Paenibacillus phyllosphaerae TaxID=274593 RepID=A0A7W5FNF7_9BACL|nr:rhodanese-like domain-containing protein [Paenibacillus phyllosphaerae]MBB3111087.1 rhodanese-related sulfurtransferase [Paenibacillus phyllosphaerae]
MTFNSIIDVAIVLLIIWLLYLQFGPVRGLKTLGEEAFRESLASSGDAVLIDVREAHEFKDGYIPGAKNIPLSALNKRLDEIPEDRSVYLYCRSGARSKRAARVLRSKGYARLTHLKGGIGGWRGKLSKW